MRKINFRFFISVFYSNFVLDLKTETMETLAILLTLFLGIYVGVLVTLIIIDTIETNKQIEVTNKSIKQLTERLENEKKKFYKDFPYCGQRD